MLVLAFVAAPRAQTPTPVATPEQRATAFVELLVQQNFVAVVASFDETLQVALPEDRLRAAWMTTLQQAGAFRRPVATSLSAAAGSQTAIVTCEFARRSMDVQIVYDRDARVTSLFVRPTPAPWKPPTYATAGAFTDTSTTIGTGEWALPASLTLPSGPGPFPAVVLVHRAGLQDRDESIASNKPFKDLAVGLAARGIAVLRFDKRTKIHAAKLATTGRFTVKEESMDDALAAVETLRANRRIDRTRIVVLGHGLGGMLVPRIAQLDRRIAGFIVMAGAARSLEGAMLAQAHHLAIADGTVTPSEQLWIDEMQTVVDRVRALTPANIDDAATIGGAPASYWLDLQGYDPAAVATAITAPMLVLQGERDYEVTMDDYAKWRAALGSTRTVTWKTYPALDHLFIAGRGPSQPSEYFIAGHVDAAVIRDITAWIRTLK